jgi:hypothetical protein
MMKQKKTEMFLHLPKAVDRVDGECHGRCHGTRNKDGNPHDPHDFVLGRLRDYIPLMTMDINPADTKSSQF